MEVPRRNLLKNISHPNAAGVLAYLACGLIVLLLIIPQERISDPFAKILSSLMWPCLILAGCLLFRENLESLFVALVKRMGSGEPFKILNVIEFPGRTIEEKAARIPEPVDGNAITLANVALLHTSFLPKRRPNFADALTYFQIEIIVIAPMPVMSRIKSVTYRFEESYPPEHREQIRTNREDRFKIKELANGTSIVQAEVKFVDSDRPLHMNRFIDLRPDGPRI